MRDGVPAVVRYTALMLTFAVLGFVAVFAAARWVRLGNRRVAQLSFLLPAALLLGFGAQPDALAAVVGGFIGIGWSARHSVELGLLADGQRDRYSAQVIALDVVVGLVATLAASLALALTDDAAEPLLQGYAVLALLGALIGARAVPDAAPMALERPLAVVRQPAFKRTLPLYFLESGMMGVGLVIGSSAAAQALGSASHYGWATSAATLAGAAGLYALRTRRHAANRVRSMGYACIGLAAAQGLLGASTWLPALYVLHLLLQSVMHPFWRASEQVLNQRAMDLHGALADRIVLRELVLWASRLAALYGFWALASGWSSAGVIGFGAALMTLSMVLEWQVGRHWMAADTPQG